MGDTFDAPALSPLDRRSTGLAGDGRLPSRARATPTPSASFPGVRPGSTRVLRPTRSDTH